MIAKWVSVFGGSGFFGSYVVDELVRKKYEVFICDINTPHRDDIPFKKIDIMNAQEVEEAVSGANYVYNFAGMAGLEDSIKNPVLSVNLNVIGNLNILEACRKRNIKRVFFIHMNVSGDIRNF